jgi:hypothetical protein
MPTIEDRCSSNKESADQQTHIVSNNREENEMRIWDGNRWRVPLSAPREITKGRNKGSVEVAVQSYQNKRGLKMHPKRIIVDPSQIRHDT